MPFDEKRRVQIYSEEVGCGLLLLFNPGDRRMIRLAHAA